jgi:hypothetical protein
MAVIVSRDLVIESPDHHHPMPAIPAITMLAAI